MFETADRWCFALLESENIPFRLPQHHPRCLPFYRPSLASSDHHARGVQHERAHIRGHAQGGGGDEEGPGAPGRGPGGRRDG